MNEEVTDSLNKADKSLDRMLEATKKMMDTCDNILLIIEKINKDLRNQLNK